jgi:hypothetical protein
MKVTRAVGNVGRIVRRIFPSRIGVVIQRFADQFGSFPNDEAALTLLFLAIKNAVGRELSKKIFGSYGRQKEVQPALGSTTCT